MIIGGSMLCNIRCAQHGALYHHGVKGQKWGVRNGPPYPIEDKVLRKGTRLNSVSGYSNSDNYRDNKRWMYTYNPDDAHDAAIYKGPFSYYKLRYAGQRAVYEHQYEVAKDLKMPTKKERIDGFIETFSNNNKVAVKELGRVQKMMRISDIGSQEAKKIDLKNLKTEKDYITAYEIFGHAMENADSLRTTKAYADLMSQKYDAMVDDNNQGIYNDAHDPIIIFRANEALKTIGNARMIDVNEIVDNYKAVAETQKKNGKEVLL